MCKSAPRRRKKTKKTQELKVVQRITKVRKGIIAKLQAQRSNGAREPGLSSKIGPIFEEEDPHRARERYCSAPINVFCKRSQLREAESQFRYSGKQAPTRDS